MKTQVSSEDYALLLESIQAAKGPGVCQYVIDDQPGCVVAQYAFRKGVTLEQLKTWDRSWHGSESLQIDAVCNKGLNGTEVIEDHMDVLAELQGIWDEGDREDVSRAYMTYRLAEMAEVTP